MLALLGYFFVFLHLSSAVDRNKFKKCENLNFCNTFFNNPKSESHVTYNVENVDCSKEATIIADIKSESNHKYKLIIEALHHQTIRLRIKDESANENYHVFEDFSYVFKDFKEPTLNDDQHPIKENGRCTLSFNNKNSHVSVAEGPFNLKVVIDETHSIVINDLNQLRLSKLGEKTDTENADDTESVGVDINFYGYQHLYGLPEHTMPLVLNNNDKEPYRLFNLDVFEYELAEKMSLYGNIPFVQAHSADSSIGLLWLNPSQTFVHVSDITNSSNKIYDFFFKTNINSAIGSKSLWLSEAGYIDIFIFGGGHPSDVSYQYSQLTGFQQLPQIFALGYHQCRWNYNDEQDVLSVHKKFDEYDIPVDTIWLDIEYAIERKYFQWNKQKFPNTIEMTESLVSKNRKLVYIVDPHIKADQTYHIYNDAESNNVLVKDNGVTYHGHCWPGDSVYPDFFKSISRQWWSNLFLLNNAKDTSLDMYMWNDMNEPSVFNGPEGTFPRNVLHDDKYFNYQVHNLYGLLSVYATYDGYLKRSNNRLRPFILTRSFFAGSQKFGAMWTGDNFGRWDHLDYTVPMLLSLSISGFHFCGADVGGFFENPTPELLVRWFQAGSLQPFFRMHSHIETKRREPWLSDKKHFDIIKDALELRYRLLPYIYTLFGISHFLGTPVMRPLWFEFPNDQRTFSLDREYMLGYGLLVMPVTKELHFYVDIYIPGSSNEKWCEFDLKQISTSNCYNGASQHRIDAPLDKVTVLQQPGTIIPVKLRRRRSSKSMRHDPITLKVLLNSKDEAEGKLYLDDEETMDYADGHCVMMNLTLTNNVLTSSINKFVPFKLIENNVNIEQIIVSTINSINMTWKKATIVSTDSVKENVIEFIDEHTFIIRKPKLLASKPFNIMFK